MFQKRSTSAIKSLDEVKSFNELGAMQVVQKALESTLTKGFDATKIANESFTVARKLKGVVDKKVDSLTKWKSSPTRPTITPATPHTQGKQPERPKLQQECHRPKPRQR